MSKEDIKELLRYPWLYVTGFSLLGLIIVLSI